MKFAAAASGSTISSARSGLGRQGGGGTWNDPQPSDANCALGFEDAEAECFFCGKGNKGYDLTGEAAFSGVVWVPGDRFCPMIGTNVQSQTWRDLGTTSFSSLTCPERGAMVTRLASNRCRQDAVLLLHGLSGSPLEMQYLERRASQAGFRAYNPSIPGCGVGTRKDRFDTGTWHQWLAFVSGELDALSRDHERVYVAGLCIGAVLGLRLAIERPQQVAGLALVSTTLAYDGWQVPWYRILAPLAYHTPLRRMIVWPERHPFGLKNARLRQWVVRAMQTQGISAAGAPCLPLSGIHEAQRLIRAVRRDIACVTAPTLILQAIEDDVTSTRSAEFVALHVGSRQVRTVLYRDSYHLLTIDNDRESVADEMIGFFHGPAGATTRQVEAHGQRPRPQHLSLA